MTFDEERFPSDISRGATARTRRVVDVVTLRSGHEERNTIWANSRRNYDIALGLRDIGDIYATIEFWEARRGRLRGFRFKDWSDFKSTSPISATSNLDQEASSITTSTYQLQKTYSVDINPWVRSITKPVENSVSIAEATVQLVNGADYLVDYTTGLIYFGYEPTGLITAGYEYDVPVRFEAEELEINVALFDVGSIPSVNLVELRESTAVEDPLKVEEALYNWLQAIDINTAVNTNWTNTWGAV